MERALKMEYSDIPLSSIYYQAAMSSKSEKSDIISRLERPDGDSIYANVQDGYSRAARTHDSSYGHTVASAFGYSKEELAKVPDESNLGLSCGNPFAIAKLREGEMVVDLGSGAGFDVFQAAAKVGASGKVIGVDMNKVDSPENAKIPLCNFR